MRKLLLLLLIAPLSAGCAPAMLAAGVVSAASSVVQVKQLHDINKKLDKIEHNTTHRKHK